MVLNSCSSDDAKQEQQNVILPKTISYQDLSDSEENYTSTISYNGDKIVNSTSTDGTKTVFTYTGNVITKTEDFENGELTDKILYTYESGKLKEKLNCEMISKDFPNGKYITKYVYVHDGTNVINYKTYNIDPTTQVETENIVGALTFQGLNLIQDIEYTNISKVSKSRDYKYDEKNNSHSKVLGFDLLLDPKYSRNNILEYSYSTNGAVNYIVTYSYIYNDNGFPVTQNYLGTDGIVKRIETIKY